MSAESSPDGVFEFSFDLRLEISRALSAYLASGERGRLHAATQRVCTEAHARRLTPDQVVLALRELFDRTPIAGDVEPGRRRAAWEEFTQSCISAYFNAGDDE